MVSTTLPMRLQPYLYNALSAPVAVMWAGFCNFLGVMVASGAVAYGIIALLPVELIMNVR
jgi:PiT family inorganic phosphate transporter